MRERWLQAIAAINQSSGQQVVPSSFTVGTQVWLEGTHLRLLYQATKLAPKRYGPFEVIREISPVAYQLRLPVAWNIHDVFHASLLSPYRETDAHGPNYSRPSPDLIEGEEEYEVEKVINHRHAGRARTLQYLIKWKGYPEADNTWEPADQVHAPQIIKAYHRQHPLEDKRGQPNARTAIRILSPIQQCLPTDQSIKASNRQCRLGRLLPSNLQGRSEHRSFGTPTPFSPTRRYKESWDPTALNSASSHKSEAALSPLNRREMSPKERTCTLWCSTASSTPWPKPPGGRTADMQSRKGSLKKPLTTSRGQESQRNGSTQSDHSKKPHPGTKRTEEKSTSTCHVKTAYDAPPSGSNEWTGEGSPVIPRTTPQGIFPSLPTYTPRKYTTTTTTKTPPGRYPHGSSLPLGGVEPPTPPSAARSTSSPFTIGVSWQRSIVTEPLTSSANPSAVKSTSSSRSFKRLASKGGLAKGGWRRPKLIARSITCGWDRRGPARNRSVFGRILSVKTVTPAMDVGVHSDEGRGVTGLGRARP